MNFCAVLIIFVRLAAALFALIRLFHPVLLPAQIPLHYELTLFPFLQWKAFRCGQNTRVGYHQANRRSERGKRGALVVETLNDLQVQSRKFGKCSQSGSNFCSPPKQGAICCLIVLQQKVSDLYETIE